MSNSPYNGEIKNLIANWKTTSAGLTMIGGSIIHLVFAILHGRGDESMWTISLATIVGGVGLLVAGDASKSADDDEALKAEVKAAAKSAIETGNTTVLENQKSA